MWEVKGGLQQSLAFGRRYWLFYDTKYAFMEGAIIEEPCFWCGSFCLLSSFLRKVYEYM